MKLTKKLEAEILKLYNKYWDAYLNGKMRIMSSLMDKNCHVIGSGMGEVFKNKKDTVKYYTATADQIAGVSEMRNRNINVAPAGNNILVTEESDFYVIMEGSWSFYGQGRFSTLFGKTEKKWLIIQQHGSLPDARTGGGEQVNTDKIKEENLRLKDAIKRRTIELENKNRELEIEAALERVRSIAMGMKKSDDLMDVSKVLLTELNTLGFENIRNTQIDILNDDKESFLNYLYSDYGVNGVTEVIYDSHAIVTQFVNDVRSAPDALSFKEVTGRELDEWREHREKNNHLPDPKLEEAISLYYYCYSIGTGALGVSSFSLISDEKLEILKRFRNVFELAHRRYSDIAQAEAQAIEAQIETALERVRSRTMAMHKSDELADTAAHLFRQLSELGIHPYRCNIGIVDAEKDKCQLWSSTNKGDVIPLGTFIPLTETPSFINIYAAWKKKLPHSVMKLIGKDRLEMIKYFIQFMPYAEFKPEEMTLEKISQVTSIFNIFNFKQGFINIHTNTEVSEADINVIQRFTKVFEQTYSRFLDLQKAEEQSREAQIETALERVRSRSMAMHKSEELSETAEVLFEQINLLGKIPDRMSIGIINEESKNVEFWVTDQGGNQLSHEFFFSLDEPTSIVKIYNAWKERKDSFVVDLTGQKLQDWLQFVKENAQLPVDETKIIGRRVQQAAFFSQGFLLLTTHEPVADEIINLLVRFAKVFDQTYRRFLDLQKAEEQARKAQIEAALERVRSKTMAMHNSHDVGVTVVTLFDEVLKLGLDKSIRCGICIFEETEQTNTWSATSSPNGEVDLKMGKLDMTIHPLLAGGKRAWKSGKTRFIYELTGEDVKIYYDALNNEPDYPFHVELDTLPKKMIHNSFFFSEGSLFAFTEDPISEETAKVLNRFASVFGQTYRRYLDLQKAESQAREAQIEASLERVRSRTMAMHKSYELSETATVFFEQMHSLGELPDRIGISIINDEEKFFEVWVTNQDGTNLEHRYSATIEEPTSMAKIYAAWKAKKDYIIIDLQGQELKKWIKFVREEVKMTVDDKNIKGRRIHNAAFFSNGVLLCTTHDPVKDEVIKLLVRFAKVFDQTYRRFLDLQKAEAQAKEAQIEASLEKVRSRTMAMHKSYELAETASVLFEQFSSLGIVPKRCSIGIINSANQAADFWMTSSEGEVIRGANTVPMNEHQQLIDLYNSWEKEKKHYNFILKGKARAEWTDYLMNQVKIFIPEYLPEKRNQSELLSEPAVFNCFFFAQGFIMLHTVEDLAQEDIPTLERFAGVFEQTYTRFLDLKKAEAQAREAQIESALERVRSKTMAMHNSHDVGVTVVTLFDEVLKLGLDKSIRCGIGILEGTEHMETWSATSYPNGEVDLKMGMLDMTIHPMLIGLKKAWESGETSYSYEYIGNDLVRYYNALNNEPGYPFFVELDSLPEKEFHNSFFFSEGILFAFTLNPISEEAARVLNRFAGVFGQTYRRYLDLQKAEAQAREAQIEAALERVRTNAMAMQSSDDLAKIVEIVFTELKKVGFETIRCGIGIIENAEAKKVDIWSTTLADDDLSIQISGDETLEGHPLLDGIFKSWKNQEEFSYILEGEDLKKYYDTVAKTNFQLPDYSLNSNSLTNKKHYNYLVNFKAGGLYAFRETPFNEEIIQIMRRFVEVFHLAYTRYEDLKKVEAQAREAQIEAALERVRSKTMAMHKSDDLTSAVATVFEELRKLGLKTIRCGVGIFDGKNRKVNVWTSSSSEKSNSVQVSGDEMLEGHSLLDGIYDSWQRQQDYSYVLKGGDLIKYYNVAADSNLPVKAPEVNAANVIQYYHCVMFPAGGLFAFRESEFSAEAIRLMRRFADVFHLTFIRHLDLKNAEAQNKIIQADNERKTQELEEARQLQLSMLPKELPKLPDLDIAVYMQTATEVGGDYYDFHVGKDGTLTVVVGDATGHGMKAGTVVTITKSLFNNLASKKNILDNFKNISRVIKDMKFRQLAMCLIMLKIKENKLWLSSAAMPPVLVYRKKSQSVEELFIKGMPLGAMNNFPYTLKESHLEKGDVILMLTDGLPELVNDKNGMYGYDRTKTEFHSVREHEPKEIVEHLKNSASQWVNGNDPDDDVTFVVIKVK